MKAQYQEDKVLINKFNRTNDQVWLVRLFQKYDHIIYGVCLRYSQDPEWSKDLKSQIYEKLLSKTKHLQTEQFIGWLHSLCKNHCIDEIRKKNRNSSFLDKFKKYQILNQEHVYFSAEKRLIIEQDEKAVQLILKEATNMLSVQQKQCMDLFYTKRLSYLKISQETGMNLGQIKSHLQNGKRKMKQYVFKHYKEQY